MKIPHQLAAITAAVSALASVAPASAQGVTLAGVADAATRYVKNDGSGAVKSVISGGNSTSRLIIRGTEDLGGGVGAGFWLEHGIALDTGNPASTAQFWDRRSTVSLTHAAAGEVRMGRDFVPSYVNWGRYDPFGYVGVAASANLITASQNGPIRSAFSTSPNTAVRSSNAFQWLLPSGWAGLEGGLMAAVGEGGTAANGQHKVLGARLGWANKQFGVSAATTRTENNLTAAAGGRLTDNAIGGNASFGAFRVSLAYRVFEQAAAKQSNAIAGLWAQFGAHEFKASFTQANLSGRVGNTRIDANDARQLGLGYVYSLSRRSALYASLARLDNEGSATYVVPGGAALTAGGSSTGFEVGIRHTF